MTPELRTAIYGVGASLILILTSVGAITEQQGVLYTGMGTSLIALVVALIYRPTGDKLKAEVTDEVKPAIISEYNRKRSLTIEDQMKEDNNG